MASDNFDYYYSEDDDAYIDEEVSLFESRQSRKTRRTKQKIRKPLCSVPARTLKSFPTVIKAKCMNESQTPKAEKKSFRYDRYPKKPVLDEFECDRAFQVIQPESTLTSSSHQKTETEDTLKINNSSQSTNSHKELDVEQLTDFSSFRRYFYQSTHSLIRSSFDNKQFTKIIDVRLASINKSVQNHFMNQLKTYSYFPQLVYHGTEMNNIESILRYGLLVPYQQHPTIPEAPVIRPRTGQVYGTGIYCHRTARSAFVHADRTNTLLVCAALPKRRGRDAIIDGCYGDILVLKEESRVIPLFLLDVQYSKRICTNYPWFNYKKTVPVREKKPVTRTNIVSRKYLRKILNCMNDEIRKNDLYQKHENMK